MKLIIFLFSILTSNFLQVSEELKTNLHKLIPAKYAWSEEKVNEAIKFMEANPDLSFTKYLSAGVHGIVIQAVRKNKETNKEETKAFKIQIDDTDLSETESLYNDYDKIKSDDPENCIIKIEEPFIQDREVDNETVSFVGIEMNEGFPGELKYFKKDLPINLQSNTFKMFKFVLKLLKEFNYMHKVKGFYHGDVKPHNWLVSYTENRDVEPIIIDFDFLFEHPKLACERKGIDYYQAPREWLKPSSGKPGSPTAKGNEGNNGWDLFEQNMEIDRQNEILRQAQSECNPDIAIYSAHFRPPELRDITMNSDFSEGIEGKEELKKWVERRWDKDFKEECFAIGKSIDYALDVNKNQLSKNNKYYDAIKLVSTNLQLPLSQRWTLDTAIREMEKVTRNKKLI